MVFSGFRACSEYSAVVSNVEPVHRPGGWSRVEHGYGYGVDYDYGDLGETGGDQPLVSPSLYERSRPNTILRRSLRFSKRWKAPHGSSLHMLAVYP